ncbi:heat-inducible transcriptional repressor HrcA [Notoacmeibacter marinus]|uniref:Heat-inducible transcription repressor HrcA n=1 Tax=Notoacmeibacter marinus TaxID=1876515 RepID=A0A231V1D5_9HYPH|nr:heat-inducible transcriptional repressor HrcA [Notoacmeibacter marinus]OXT01924.1 heat-inducible transcriptional repressor HrcA [Notoacmeibacter marinus]
MAPRRPVLNIADDASGGGLDGRSREIFRLIVESYLDTGEPLGSRNLARMLPNALSAATVRNVMSDLEYLGLIYSPHTSAGRMPTEGGLRFFVDAFMELGGLGEEDRQSIDRQVLDAGRNATMDSMLTEASQLLSGLTHGAGLVVAGKAEIALKHVEFVMLEPGKALAILVAEGGEVENRIVDLPAGVTPSQLTEAANFLNHNVRGRTLAEAREEMTLRLEEMRQEIDSLSADLVRRGLAIWGEGQDDGTRLIVRGRSNLLGTLQDEHDLSIMRHLFDDLERKENLVQLLDLAEEGSGVRIFIGSENRLFSLSGSSLVVAPYRDGANRVVGALGVIGPTRLNYRQVVPVVDYTAQVISKMLSRS